MLFSLLMMLLMLELPERMTCNKTLGAERLGRQVICRLIHLLKDKHAKKYVMSKHTLCDVDSGICRPHLYSLTDP